MKINHLGQRIYSQEDLILKLRQDPDAEISGACVDFAWQDDLELGLEFCHPLGPDTSQEDYDRDNQAQIAMPDSYRDLDIAQYVLDLCHSDQQRQRVGEELLLFWDRGMFPLLQYLKYLVDTMRDNSMIWGVGRGSSVASYVLYLLGVHKVDSLRYELDIQEFLR